MDKREDSLPPDDIVVADDRDAGRDPPPQSAETELDEDDRLKPAFVRDVIDLAEAGEVEAARGRVGRVAPPPRPPCCRATRPVCAGRPSRGRSSR
mgnify:CR=1 FL=1